MWKSLRLMAVRGYPRRNTINKPNNNAVLMDPKKRVSRPLLHATAALVFLGWRVRIFTPLDLKRQLSKKPTSERDQTHGSP